MNYIDRLQNVTILGAAGKMGSGILLLTAIEMTDQCLKPENKGRCYVLNAMDTSNEGLAGLMQYLKIQVMKIAEKKAVMLRKMYEDRKDLIENGEIIEQYVFDVLSLVRTTTKIESAYESTLIFEAIKEDPALKVRILSQIDKNNPNKPFYFTNTSSIPISKLDKEANLGGRVLGVHFYNPPAIQRLVEVIKGDQTLAETEKFALDYIKKLKKIAVPSNDFAGFIGNGHFMRDALHGISEALKLSKEMPLVEAIYVMNKITQDFLIRPMGIFQLIDYVGIDVCSYIMSVMNPYLPNENLHSDVLDKMIEQGVMGGQYSSGAQKDGFLKYEKNRLVAIWDIENKEYVSIDNFKAKADAYLENMPTAYIPWKNLNFSKEKNTLLEKYFAELNTMNTKGAILAKAYNIRSNEIGNQLVADKVANNKDDVNTVMLTGFYHAYGPINEYLK